MTGHHAVVHIGTMKTGTSTLQSTLAANTSLLAEHGYRYAGWPMRTSARLAARLAEPDSAPNVVISDEGLWHFCGSERSDTEQIASLLESYDVTLVVYFRRPDEYVESWFSQGLKTGLGSPDLTTFLGSGFVNSRPFRPAESDEPPGLDNPSFRELIDLAIESKLDYFRSVFPEARFLVRPYERAQLLNGDIVDDFFATVGLCPPEHADRLIRRNDENVSPGADTVLFANLLRRRYDVPDDLLEQFLRSHSPPAIRLGVRRRILTATEAQTINEVMRPVFERVQSAWGGGDGDDFFRDWTVDPSTHQVSDVREAYDRALATRA